MEVLNKAVAVLIDGGHVLSRGWISRLVDAA